MSQKITHNPQRGIFLAHFVQNCPIGSLFTSIYAFSGEAIIYFVPGRLKSCKGIQISHWENGSENGSENLYLFVLLFFVIFGFIHFTDIRILRIQNRWKKFTVCCSNQIIEIREIPNFRYFRQKKLFVLYYKYKQPAHCASLNILVFEVYENST